MGSDGTFLPMSTQSGRVRVLPRLTPSLEMTWRGQNSSNYTDVMTTEARGAGVMGELGPEHTPPDCRSSALSSHQAVNQMEDRSTTLRSAHQAQPPTQLGRLQGVSDTAV